MEEEKIVNKKGFMLVETLIVTVFIMGIFTILYTNYFPLLGEYERYNDYDSVESTYVTYWARSIALKGLPDSVYLEVRENGYKDVSDCSLYINNEATRDCAAYKLVNNVSKIYLTTYAITSFKDFVRDNDLYNRDFREYIAFLPTYSKNISKASYYRIIVEYDKNYQHQYGNLEVYHD